MTKTSSNATGTLLYITELRRRLLYCFLVLALIFASLFYFTNDIYTLLASPLLRHLPKGQGLIAINITAPFFAPFNLTLIAAFFLTMPFFLYQLWAFVAPALYQHERARAKLLLWTSIFLFYAGIAFAYFILFPVLFGFLTRVAPRGVQVSPDITQYLNFSLKFFCIFGIFFEVPVITVILVLTGIVSCEKLIKFRLYAIGGAFILSLLFAPPDIISQIIVATPLWLLFEIGIMLARFFARKNTHDSQK